MTIIDFMRQKLTEYPKIADFLGGEEVHIDFTDPEPVNYGLSGTGDSLLKQDILGNQLRQHNFVMYAVGQSFTDYNRLANSNFLYELSQWLEHLPEEEGISFEIDGQTGGQPEYFGLWGEYAFLIGFRLRTDQAFGRCRHDAYFDAVLAQ